MNSFSEENNFGIDELLPWNSRNTGASRAA
jgi:hypothetical protein